jgi:hypothetical protein
LNLDQFASDGQPGEPGVALQNVDPSRCHRPPDRPGEAWLARNTIDRARKSCCRADMMSWQLITGKGGCPGDLQEEVSRQIVRQLNTTIHGTKQLGKPAQALFRTDESEAQNARVGFRIGMYTTKKRQGSTIRQWRENCPPQLQMPSTGGVKVIVFLGFASKAGTEMGLDVSYVLAIHYSLSQ